MSESPFDARSDWPPFHIMLGLISPVAVPILLFVAVVLRIGLAVERLGQWAVPTK